MVKKSSKQLQSILSQHMHAVPVPMEKEESHFTLQSGSLQSIEKETRITLTVPESVKIQLKKRIAYLEPGETVRSLILRALKASYSLEIDEDQIRDKRHSS